MGGRILLVEENGDLCDLLVMLLEGQEHEVRATSSGEEGILLAARERFDLAIVDLEAKDISGIGVAHVVQDLAPMPVILTSLDASTWKPHALEAGASAWLPKPFGTEDLSALVRSLLKSKEPGVFPGDVETLDEGDLARIRSMSDEELDELPFGLIRVDRKTDRIVGFNSYEQEASGYLAQTVIGLRLADVAPCMKVKAFAQRIDEAVRDPGGDHVLRYVFPRRAAESVVSVRLFYDVPEDRLWVFISKRSE